MKILENESVDDTEAKRRVETVKGFRDSYVIAFQKMKDELYTQKEKIFEQGDKITELEGMIMNKHDEKKRNMIGEHQVSSITSFLDLIITISIPLPLKAETQKEKKMRKKANPAPDPTNESNPKSGTTVDATTEEKKKKYIDQILNNLCALRNNSDGGILKIENENDDKEEGGHLSDLLLGTFEKKLKHIDDELQKSTDVSEHYKVEELDGGESICITITGGTSIATVGINSKTALKQSIEDSSKEEIMELLTKQSSHSSTFPSFLDTVKQIVWKKEVKVPESERLQYKGIEFNITKVDDVKYVRKKITDRIGEELHKCGSAFTKIREGGSLVLGVNERRESIKGRTFWTILGVPLHLCDKDCANLDCDECYIRGYCRKTIQTKMLWMSKTNESVYEEPWEGISQHYYIRFLPIEGKESWFLIEVAFKWFNGISFYRREGPDSFKVSGDRKKIQRLSTEEWLMTIIQEKRQTIRGASSGEATHKSFMKKEETNWKSFMSSLDETVSLITNLVKKHDRLTHEEALLGLFKESKESFSQIIITTEGFLKTGYKTKCIQMLSPQNVDKYSYLKVLDEFILYASDFNSVDDDIFKTIVDLKKKIEIVFNDCRRNRQQHNKEKKDRKQKISQCETEVKEREKVLGDVSEWMAGIKALINALKEPMTNGHEIEILGKESSTTTEQFLSAISAIMKKSENLQKEYIESVEHRINKLKELRLNLSKVDDLTTSEEALSTFVKDVNEIIIKFETSVILPYNILKTDITPRCKNIQKLLYSYIQMEDDSERHFAEKEIGEISKTTEAMNDFANTFQECCEQWVKKLDCAREKLYS